MHWAHQPAVRSAFPHGRLYLNLQGFSDHPPLAAADALRGLLGQLGVPGTEIPSDLGQAQRLYRRRLDGRRVLVILDNAIDAAQVRPLLAGPPGLSLVTSRNRLTGLAVQEGAAHIQLGRLPDGDAQVLVNRLLGEHHPPQLTSRLSETCANLPLAIRLAAAGYRAAHPDTRLGDYLEQLAADRIGLLDAGAERATAITSVLHRSVERLPPELVRAFQLAGLHPGPRADAAAIAALLEVTEQQYRRVVRELAGASLLEETSPGRWSMHDLLAEYARHRTGPEAGAAYARLLEHYTTRLTTEPIDHRWINGERGALLACLRLPAEPDGIERYALRLGDRFFEVDLFADSRHAYEVLRQRCPADSHTYALATFGIGRAEVWLDEAAAEPTLNEALRHFQRLGDPGGQARTLRQLAEWNRGRGLHQEAMDLRALELFRRAGDLEGESDTLIGLALESTAGGDYPGAREQATRAPQLALQTGSARRRGESHRVLGHVASLTGAHGAATDHYTQALSLFTSVGVQRGRGLVLMNLGDAAMAAGEYQRAVEHQRQALAIFTEVSHRNDQAHAYLRLGKTALATDDPARAREHFSRALETNRELGNRAGIAFNLLGLAHVLLATGEQHEAAEQYRRVAADLAELGYPRGEAEARLGLGRALAATGDHRGGRERMESALGLFEKIGSPQAAEAREALRRLPAPPPANADAAP